MGLWLLLVSALRLHIKIYSIFQLKRMIKKLFYQILFKTAVRKQKIGKFYVMFIES